ncbi:hypothetical protein [Endozoicomonas lisbonensis]|uniref:Uncharacterized protein n=1 Tax=Endozoicomonas lisbonensis TaxID=3120522 RepID=A0ABV2SE17_9GAMM
MNSSLLILEVPAAEINKSENIVSNNDNKSDSYFFKAYSVSKQNIVSVFTKLDDSALFLGSALEKTCRDIKEWPQYKYFTRPLYKTLASRIPRPISAFATFLIADIVLHQIPFYYLTPVDKRNFTEISSCSYPFIFSGLLVAYKKYRSANDINRN